MTTKLVLVVFLVAVITANLAHAQVSRKLPRVGYLTIRSTPSEQDDIFKHALRDLGWLEGQNYILEWRGASANVDNLSVRVTELVRLSGEVIVVSSTPSVQAARRATNTIPIIMAGAADPVGTGFVKSLSHPGGNITGLSLQSPELAGKRLELLKDITPKLDRVAFLAYRPDPAHRLFVREAENAAG
ncbi:MAG TPA: ABC transporter substrate-binding protein, partial [Candidatus Binatia bacterium]|nr:ABC transporter substrate-binding protein [Candidatus Binatia bacterium]